MRERKTRPSAPPAGPAAPDHTGTIPRVVLASASPRRQELLRNAGVRFDVRPSRVEEVPLPGEAAERFARRIAREKALEVAVRHPRRFVLAGDTIVVLDGLIFGKPADRREARRMLRALSGRAHRVLTAIALVDPDGAVDEVLVESVVHFRPLEESEVDAYVETDEPFDKAGGYAVQGEAARFVVRVDGSYTNVVGLPVDEVCSLLRRRTLGHGETGEAVR